MESHRRYGYLPRCSDLRWHEVSGRYVCLLMDDPEQGAAAREALNEGQGCCAPLNRWRDDVRNRDDG
jgi:hypothetical protein